MTATATGNGRRKRAVRSALVAALVAGGGLLSVVPASVFIFATPSPSFPSSVTVGQTFTGSVALSNFSTPPESTANPLLTVSAIDLAPACKNGVSDCTGGIDAGVVAPTTGTGLGSGNATCAGVWTVTQTMPGMYRLNPPGGNGTLLVATGETCTVDVDWLAVHMPTLDTSAAPGQQTLALVSATFTGTTVGSIRNSGNDLFTVNPPPMAPPSDFDGDGTTDLAVFRPSNNVWYSSGASVVWGASGDIPVPGDYDFDGTIDRAVYRPSSNVWYVLRSGGGATSAGWGAAGDIPVPGDYDADGRTDQAVFRPSSGVWYVARSAGGATSIGWGTTGDIPVPGDYDGDSRADQAVFRPSSGAWYIQRSSGGATSTSWGLSGDVPVPGDYDGDGKTDLAVFRPSAGAWYVQRSSGGGTFGSWGVAGDIPVPGDYDADGLTDQAVFRPSSSVWFVQRTSGGATSTGWGVTGDIPLPLPAAIGRFFFTPPFP